MPRLSIRSLTALPVLFPLLVLPFLVGCPSGRKVDSEQAQNRAAQRRMRQSNALLDNVVAQLRRLPEATQLVLRPPTVLLDSRTSADGEDVLAIVRRRPDSPWEEPPNQLVVPSGNARFKSIGVAPGDTLKYFVLLDRESRQRLAETGEADIVMMEALNMQVAQVLDNNSLLIAGGLPSEWPTPTRLEVWRNVDDRMDEIDSRLGRYVKRRDPPLSWQPSGDEVALGQMTEFLNQWFRSGRQQQGEDWSPPELLETLGADTSSSEEAAPYFSHEELSEGGFRPHETRLLQEATWLRDVGVWARGDSLDRVDQAASLFDWVVRNLQLVEDEVEAPHFVWETMLYGRATARQRAWAFARLCRQQGLTAAVALVPVEKDAEYALSVVLVDEQLYVFDPALGLPLPGADEGAVATLAALREDDALLRRMDLPDAPCPLTAEALARARLAVVAEPLSLSRRAERLGNRLSGKDLLALSVDADAVAERLAEAAPGAEVVLWDFPFRTYVEKLTVGPTQRNREVRAFLPFAWRPALWKGRTLHFRGRYETPGKSARDVLAGTVDDHQAAMQLYMNPTVRPTEKELDKEVGSEVKREIYNSTKAMATFWLGVLAYERGDLDNAVYWLKNKTLRLPSAAPIADGVRYHLARALEARGELAEAIRLLEQDDSPQRHGNRLRAGRLAAVASEGGEDPSEGEAP